MKNYLVLVEAEDYINVEAMSPEEAMSAAKDIANGGYTDWKTTVMHVESDLGEEI